MVKNRKEIACKIAGLLILGMALIGCRDIFATSIHKIIENPRDFSGKHVVISGEVTEVFSLFVVRYFVVKDRTGEITVVTKRPLPKKGTKITVKGTVEEAFSFGEKQAMVIIEDEEK